MDNLSRVCIRRKSRRETIVFRPIGLGELIHTHVPQLIPPDAHIEGDEFTFEKDLSVLKDLPGNGFCALTAGWMTVKSTNGKVSRDRFYIPDTKENPVLYYYRETAQGLNFELSLVQVIKANQSKADRLFIGGDFEWKRGFDSYRRK